MTVITPSPNKKHLVLPFDFGNNKDILTIFGEEITKTKLNLILSTVLKEKNFTLNV